MPLKMKSTRRRNSYRVSAYTYRMPLPVKKQLQLPNGDSFPICPRCDRTIDREYMNFCDRCGQRLAWEFFEFADTISAPRNRKMPE